MKGPLDGSIDFSMASAGSAGAGTMRMFVGLSRTFRRYRSSFHILYIESLPNRERRGGERR